MSTGEARQNWAKKRGTPRRLADKHLQAQAEKYARLIQAGQIITAELNVDELFHVISDQTGKILDVERCSIFLADADQQHLCSFVAADMGSDQIQFSTHQGIAGWVFCNRTPQVVNDAYGDARFYQAVDKKTGFRTVNILCVPLISHRRNCIGTMQVLNKRGGDFTDEDVDILTYMASYVAVALENASLYEELKETDRARQKAVNHLSHELRTPLSILSSVLTRFADTAHDHDLTHLTRTIERGRRCIDRLNKIQEKAEDIVGRKVVDCEKQYTRIFEDLISLVEETGEDTALHCGQLAAHVVDRIQSILAFEPERIEPIQVDRFLKDIYNDAVEIVRKRRLRVSLAIEAGLTINMDASILKKICDGLLKNAIENTPDGGRIKLTAGATEADIFLAFQDHGVGITPANQKNIFKGFFHTQPTQFYSSKTPYAFNAGGTGTDLLRMQTYAERLGFNIDFSSQRCRFIPGEADACPGGVSLCDNITAATDCMDSGGSVFTVRFPKIGRTRSAR
ncbi:MAG: GAF domain-containing protein [Desulfobacteraceae bacterium]|jgi:signal transduction histidine kinase|nr:GAF domain-containing protein [Desulfobacteraceae bacterium]